MEAPALPSRGDGPTGSLRPSSSVSHAGAAVLLLHRSQIPLPATLQNPMLRLETWQPSLGCSFYYLLANGMFRQSCAWFTTSMYFMKCLLNALLFTQLNFCSCRPPGPESATRQGFQEGSDTSALDDHIVFLSCHTTSLKTSSRWVRPLETISCDVHGNRSWLISWACRKGSIHANLQSTHTFWR